jgi:hypothetical protein
MIVMLTTAAIMAYLIATVSDEDSVKRANTALPHLKLASSLRSKVAVRG